MKLISLKKHHPFYSFFFYYNAEAIVIEQGMLLKIQFSIHKDDTSEDILHNIKMGARWKWNEQFEKQAFIEAKNHEGKEL